METGAFLPDPPSLRGANSDWVLALMTLLWGLHRGLRYSMRNLRNLRNPAVVRTPFDDDAMSDGRNAMGVALWESGLHRSRSLRFPPL